MTNRKIRRETERVVEKVLKLVESYDNNIGKKEYEEILQKVMEYVHKNTGVSMQYIIKKTGKVIEDLPNEYGQLSEDARSWKAMIAYLYLKYLKELDIIL